MIVFFVSDGVGGDGVGDNGVVGGSIGGFEFEFDGIG